ncbi:MAG: ABC transporter permease [Candidatus Marinimicrobia bacterium]|nr:ABC transporter permease [Candidatus Neomarinimicrobiota bacterium]
MRRTWIIFKKEIKDSLRDRRTILMMVVMPLLLVPAIIGGIFWIQTSIMEKAEAELSRITFIGRTQAPELYAMFEEDDRFTLIADVPLDSITVMIEQEELHGAVIVALDFPHVIGKDQQGKIEIVYKESDALETAEMRMAEVIEKYDSVLVYERITRLNLDEELFDAIAIEKKDIASVKEKLGKIAGGWLPYLFIIFGFMGAMYPGLDLGAGEKERGTLETILSSPASRLEIVLGKFLVVMLAGVITALIAMFGLYFAVQRFPEIPPEILEVILDMLGLKMVFLILTLIFPICAFFSAVILSLSIYAKSFKEAQSIVTPLSIAIIFPAVIGTLPGIELNLVTALVPILNVSLATKDMLAGTINPVYLMEVYISLALLAGLSLWVCVKMFDREETLFRS